MDCASDGVICAKAMATETNKSLSFIVSSCQRRTLRLLLVLVAPGSVHRMGIPLMRAGVRGGHPGGGQNWKSTRLIDLDVQLFHQPPICRKIFAHHCGKPFSSAADRLLGSLQEAVANCRLSERLVDPG